MAAELSADKERDLATQLPLASTSSEMAAEMEHVEQPQEPASSGPMEEPTPDGDTESRHEMIARAAYFLAEARGFEPGHELDDWLAAEQQIGPR